MSRVFDGVECARCRGCGIHFRVEVWRYGAYVRQDYRMNKITGSIHSFDDTRLEAREGADVSDAVPRILIALRLTLGFVTLQKTRHEEFPGQRCQTHAARLAIPNHTIRLVGIDNFNHRARHRRIVNDRVVVLRNARLVNSQAHQCVAVSRSEVRTFEQLFDRETMKLRRHLSAAAKDAGDSHLLQRYFLAKRFEQFWSREQAANVVVSLQQREALFDHVLLVLLGHLWLTHLQP